MEHRVQVANPEQLAEKFKSFTERFGKCTIPAILELVKQQGETTNTAATELGILFNTFDCIFIVLFKNMHYIEKLVVALKYILKSLRCGKKEKVSETMKSIMYICEVRISRPYNHIYTLHSCYYR